MAVDLSVRGEQSQSLGKGGKTERFEVELTLPASSPEEFTNEFSYPQLLLKNKKKVGGSLSILVYTVHTKKQLCAAGECFLS